MREERCCELGDRGEVPPASSCKHAPPQACLPHAMPKHLPMPAACHALRHAANAHFLRHCSFFLLFLPPRQMLRPVLFSACQMSPATPCLPPEKKERDDRGLASPCENREEKRLDNPSQPFSAREIYSVFFFLFIYVYREIYLF